MTASRKRRPSPPLPREIRRRRMVSVAAAGKFSATVDRKHEWRLLCTSIIRGVPPSSDPAQDLVDGHGMLVVGDRYCTNDDSDNEGIDEEREGGGSPTTAHVLNFLPAAAATRTHHGARRPAAADDPWLDNALRLSVSVRHMSSLLVRQEASYANVRAALPLPGGERADATAADAERSELEAAVASFAVSTANQIEALRRALETDGPANGSAAKDDASVHRSGIVSWLLSALRSDVVDRMGRMDALRRRDSLAAARDPLACRLVGERVGVGVSGVLGSGLDEGGGYGYATTFEGEAMERERERAEEEEFKAIYGRAGGEALVKELLVPPVFPRADGLTGYRVSTDASAEEEGGAFVEEGDDDVVGREAAHVAKDQSRGKRLTSAKLYDHRSPDTTKHNKNRIPSHTKSVTIVPPHLNGPSRLADVYGETAAEHEAYVEDLQRESAYLTASLQNELEDVRKIETRMGEIVNLLTQFGDLVTEQQEDIVTIHDQTEKSKDNLTKGQDSLVDATERKKRSKHRMATFVVAMALLMLLFNWITP